MNDKHKAEFEKTSECNFAIHPAVMGRFRVNIYRHQGDIGMVVRRINTDIPTSDSINVPRIVNDLVMQKRGLILLVGATGSGKSTTLAAMIGHKNRHSAGHIVTIEDPIEYIHENIRSIVSQREIGTDTESWQSAMKNAMRQAPDAIMIGEIRDKDAMESAITISETGHLCMATLHANNCNQAIERIVNFFPEERQPQILMDLSMNLRAIISQRLIPTIDKKSRVPACEIMIASPLIVDYIYKNKITEIRDVIKRSRETGMQTFDQALFDLHEAELISLDDALRFAESSNDLRLQIKLHSKLGDKIIDTTMLSI